MRINKFRDKQLLLKIAQNQNNIKDVIKYFNCDSSNLENCKYAFDLCAMYMAQIVEAAKMLSVEQKNSFAYFDWKTTNYFRNMIDHVYEKVNPKFLKAYIFQMISVESLSEISQAIIKADKLNYKSNKQDSEIQEEK